MDDQDLVQLAQELVRIPSPTYSEGDAAAFLAAAMKRIFHQVDADEMHNVVGLLKGTREGPTVLFNGHLDHVDPGEMEEPYAGKLMDGQRFGAAGQVVYGRGASDMKGAIAAMVAAAAQLRQDGFSGQLILTAVVQEEAALGAGTKRAMRDLKESPVVAISGEATNRQVYLGHRGRVEFELETIGRTSHGSNPARGINAILLMKEFLDLWPRLPMPEHSLVGRCSSAITVISCSPGRLSVVPDRCRIVLDNRFLPGESPDRPRRDLEALLEEAARANPNFKYQLKVTKVMPPFLIPPENPYAQLLRQVVEEVTGKAPSFGGWLFGTDGSFLVHDFGLPTIGFGPGNEHFAHTPEDHVPVSDLLLAKKVYVEFVKRLGASAQQPS